MTVFIRNHQRLIRINLQGLKKDSLRLLRSFNLQNAELGIALVNDRRMKELNGRYRDIARTTDVLSFPTYSNLNEIPGDREILLGDIVMNLHAAKRQAATYGNTFAEEVRRLLVHGFLHLIGFDHERNVYQKKKMKKKERDLQDALEAMD
jgi:probable rRNA maturation factor